MKRSTCEEIAKRLLDGFKVKHPELLKRLADYIYEKKKVPDIRIFWDSMKQDLDFEVLK